MTNLFSGDINEVKKGTQRNSKEQQTRLASILSIRYGGKMRERKGNKMIK